VAITLVFIFLIYLSFYRSLAEITNKIPSVVGASKIFHFDFRFSTLYLVHYIKKQLPIHPNASMNPAFSLKEFNLVKLFK